MSASRATHELINERWDAFIKHAVDSSDAVELRQPATATTQTTTRFLHVAHFLKAAKADNHTWAQLTLGLDQKLLDVHTLVHAGEVYATHRLLSRALQSHPVWQLLAADVSVVFFFFLVRYCFFVVTQVSEFHQKAAQAAQAKVILTSRMQELGLSAARLDGGSAASSNDSQISDLDLGGDDNKSSAVEEITTDDDEPVVQQQQCVLQQCMLQHCQADAAAGSIFCVIHRTCRIPGCMDDRMERDARCRLHKNNAKRHRTTTPSSQLISQARTRSKVIKSKTTTVESCGERRSLRRTNQGG